MRVLKVLAVSIAAVSTAASLLSPASAATTGPVIDNASLMNGGMPCSTSVPPMLGYFASQLEVLGSDPVPPFDARYDYTFAIWPQSDPAAVTTFSTVNYGAGLLARGRVPAGVLTSGGNYAWRVQLSDTNGTSPWSQTCVFSYDNTAPQLPTISSSNYPPNDWGPIGELAQFTFSGNGDPDTAGFVWTWGDILPVPGCSVSGPQGQLVCPDPLAAPDVVRADAPGGSATLTVSPPDAGAVDMTIAAIDRAGNESRSVTYRTYAWWTGPTVTVTSKQPLCGTMATVSFAPYPGVSGVVSYTYTLQGMNGAQPVTVKANQAGVAIAAIPLSAQPYAVTATSLSANGFQSSMGYTGLNVNPQPTVTSDVYQNSGQPTGGVGVPGSFTFSPPYDGHQVAGYQYRIEGGPPSTVAADPNSETATVQWTPNRAGPVTMTVQSINGDAPGGSCQLSYTFEVASTPR